MAESEAHTPVSGKFRRRSHNKMGQMAGPCTFDFLCFFCFFFSRFRFFALRSDSESDDRAAGGESVLQSEMPPGAQESDPHAPPRVALAAQPRGSRTGINFVGRLGLRLLHKLVHLLFSLRLPHALRRRRL